MSMSVQTSSMVDTIGNIGMTIGLVMATVTIFGFMIKEILPKDKDKDKKEKK